MTNIGTRVARLQVLGALLFLSVAALVAGGMYQIGMAMTQNIEDIRRVSSVMEVADLISENRVAQASVLLDDRPDARTLLMRRSQALSRELSTLCNITPAGPFKRMVSSMERRWYDYQKVQHRLIALVEARKSSEALALFQGELDDSYMTFDEQSDALAAGFRRDAAQSGEAARRVAEFVTVFVLTFSAFGFVARFMVQIFIHRRIVRPLIHITDSLTALAAGDTCVELSGGDRRDEIGAMVRSLEVFRAQACLIEAEHERTLEAQARAERLARHDALTGLPNRRFFTEALGRLTADLEHPAAVMMIDLDRFKPVNDAYGHDAGDAVLNELAQRFMAHRDELGTVARLGGDEFAVAFPTSADKSHATRIAQLLRVIISQPIQLDNAVVEVGATIGIALFPPDGTSPAALLRAADLAMYQAKANSHGRYRFFDPSIEDNVQARAVLHADVRRAVSAGEIVPYYQPLVAIDGGGLVGFEVLARWIHPERGLIMPDAFISAADEIGVLTDLTYRLLERVCREVREWPSTLTLSINLAPSQLRDPLIASNLVAILDNYGIAPQRIEVEVTENALITDFEGTKQVLSRLQKRGIRVALDDFGTGYASLNHLREFKFDKIKIDRSFLSGLDDGSKNEGIVRAMITLGKSLDLSITAEGIEDVSQWAHLSEWGCDFGQGYLFGKGMPAGKAKAMIAATGGGLRAAPPHTLRKRQLRA
ncbi:putative bifunctional diguanylate cyclase/phosphodiesterase [Sphingomonas sp.]|uniref:putative bifunctional diguanylate cyclase/phosphodiesterase n=1 Tax=Sphingomonas sp. TaxID=28214 RepID=UPI0035663F1E